MSLIRYNHSARGLVFALLLQPVTAFADGSAVDKVYHPYVDAMASEIEYRSVFRRDQHSQEKSSQVHQLSLGTAFGPNWFAEAKVIGTKSHSGNLDVDAYELESKWQLTEQGQYSADWGLLLEYESKAELDAEELVLGLLVEKEFGRWSGTANIKLMEQWGSESRQKLESAFALQARYRYSRGFEPAIELYTEQNATAIGPALLGSAFVGVRKSINWEAGLMFGVDSASPDTMFRILLEFEF